MIKLSVERDPKPIMSLPNLLTKVRHAREKSPTGVVWLRGHANDQYELLPSIGREHTFSGEVITFNSDLEKRLVHRFHRYAYAHVGRELRELETLCIARHHGLPVRLLDWTSNPLAALYFASEFDGKTPPSDAKIWMLIPTGLWPPTLDVFDTDADPFDLPGIHLVHPPAISPRITAQSSYFTIQDDPWTPMDQMTPAGDDANEEDGLLLREYIVPADSRRDRIKDLNDLDINRRTLLPDLDGLSAGLVNAEMFRGRS